MRKLGLFGACFSLGLLIAVATIKNTDAQIGPPGPPGDDPPAILPTVDCLGRLQTDAPNADEPSFWIQAWVHVWINHLDKSDYLYHFYQVEFRWANHPTEGPWDTWWEPQMGDGPGQLFKAIPPPYNEEVLFPGWWSYSLHVGAGEADDVQLCREYNGVQWRVTLWGSNERNPEYINQMFEMASDTWWSPMGFNASVPTKASDILGYDQFNYLTGEFTESEPEEE